MCFFKSFSLEELAALNFESECYAYHRAMVEHLPDEYLDKYYQHARGTPEWYNEYELLEKKINARVRLEKALLKSKNDFHKEAEEEPELKQFTPSIEHHKSIYKKMFMTSTEVPAVGDWYPILYSLCETKSEIALSVIPQKYQDCLQNLKENEFSLICVAAAINLLPDFVRFICKNALRLGNSIDNHSAIAYGDHSIFTGVMTPFTAAILSVIDLNEWDRLRVIKSLKIIKLLLNHGASPQKRYAVDDISDEQGYRFVSDPEKSVTIFQILSEQKTRLCTLEKYQKLSGEEKRAFDMYVAKLTEIDIKYAVDRYLATLNLNVIPKHLQNNINFWDSVYQSLNGQYYIPDILKAADFGDSLDDKDLCFIAKIDGVDENNSKTCFYIRVRHKDAQDNQFSGFILFKEMICNFLLPLHLMYRGQNVKQIEELKPEGPKSFIV